MEAFEIELSDIESFEVIKQKTKVYDIEVEDNHNFLLSNFNKPIIVHNSGKSFAVSCAMVEKTYSEYKHKILYLRQTMSSSEDSTVADVKEAIRMIGAYDFTYSKGVFTNRITGSTISFKGIRSTGTQTAKLKSLSGITTLVCEEAEEIENFEEFSKVDESIRIKGKPLKIILVYNPTSSLSSWIHRKWFKEGVPLLNRKKDTEYMHSTYLDNIDNLNESTIKQYQDLEETDPIYYKNTILAEWTLETEGRVYGGWKRILEIPSPDYDEWYGLDFGYGGKDKTSLIRIRYYDKKYYIKQIFSKPKLKLNETIELMKANIPISARIYADSAMPLLITEIKDGGFKSLRKCKKGNVEAGIKKVQNKDIVFEGDDNSIEESELYFSYMTFNRDRLDRLPHEPDELAALRYGINSKNPIDFKKSETQKYSQTRKRTGRYSN